MTIIDLCGHYQNKDFILSYYIGGIFLKAYAMTSSNNTGWIDVKYPVAGPYDAVVRTLAVSPCTSDVHIVYEDALGAMENVVLGHEQVGEVVEVGSEVKFFKPGDRVAVSAITPDWRSIEAQAGFSQHSGGLLGGYKFTVTKPGSFAEFFHVNDADMNMAILPDEISLEEGVMITDMMTTGFHGAENAEIESGSSVAVLGIGAVGLMAIAGAQLRGAGRIFGVGSRPVCVDAAKFYGATDIVNYKEGDIVAQIMDLTNGAGVDRVIAAGGTETIIAQAVDMVKPGGIVSNINFFAGADTIPIPRVGWGSGMAHKRIIGGVCPGGRRRMEMLIEMVKYKRVDLSKLVTHRYNGLENIEKAFLSMHHKPVDLIKPVVICE